MEFLKRNYLIKILNACVCLTNRMIAYNKGYCPVCRDAGINMLMLEKTLVLDKIMLSKTKGVTFKAGENTLKEKNISKDEITGEAGFVPSTLIEIVIRREEGWNYIKAGFNFLKFYN